MPQYTPYIINREYNRSKVQAIRFVNKDRFNRRVQNDKNLSIQNSPYDLSVTFQAMAPLIIIAAIGLGIWAAGNITSVTNEILMGESEVYNTVSIIAQIAAVSLTIIGLSIGKYCDLNRYSNVDELTGYRTVKPAFWFGAFFALAYLALHFFIAKYAMVASDYNSDYLLLIINVGIALFELIIGALFLGQAILIISIWLKNIQLYVSRRKMNSSAEKTDRYYTTYNTMLEEYNRQSDRTLKQSGNPYIVRAIAFFNGLPGYDLDNVTLDREQITNQEPGESREQMQQEELIQNEQEEDDSDSIENESKDKNLNIGTNDVEDENDEEESNRRAQIDPDSNMTID